MTKYVQCDIHEQFRRLVSDSASFLSIAQNAVASFKELCGLSSVANLMQCMLAVSPRFLGPENTPLVVLNLSEPYPTMELQGIVPEVLKKIVTTYDTVSRFLCFFVAQVTEVSQATQQT